MIKLRSGLEIRMEEEGGGCSGYGCCLLARVAAAYKHVVVDQGASLYGNENLCRKVQR